MAKRGLPKKVSKRNVFTPETLSTILVFSDYKNEGYDYRLKVYMNVVTKEQYSVESVREEIKAANREGALEQLEQEIEALELMAKMVQQNKDKVR